MDMSQLRSEETLDHVDRGAPRAPTQTIDVDTERTGVRTYVGRDLPRSGGCLEWIRKRLVFYHDACPLVQLGARRDCVLLQRPQRGASKVRNRRRRTPSADELRLCLARLRSEMRPLRAHDQNHARGK